MIAPALQSMTSEDEVLRVQDLTTYYPVRGRFGSKAVGYVHAVDGVTISVRRGESLGLVGESGCGKSTLARTIVGLERATSGSVILNGRDITNVPARKMRSLRRDMQLVFQDPFSSLNPRMKVGNLIAEPLIAFGLDDKAGKARRVNEVLERVGLDSASALRYPHEFSGGQRQRIGIARALILEPSIVILDEPVSALDVSIQAQVLNLLQDLQEDLGLTYVMIAHDLAVVRHLCSEVAVMYLGKIIERGSSDQLYTSPTHPYTKALLSAVPLPDPGLRPEGRRILIEGDVPSPVDPPSGCRFRTRCWKGDALCAAEEPVLTGRRGLHPCACHYAEVGEEHAAPRA